MECFEHGIASALLGDPHTVILGGALAGRFGAEHRTTSAATWLIVGVVIVSLGLRRTAPLAALYTVAASHPRAACLACTT